MWAEMGIKQSTLLGDTCKIDGHGLNLVIKLLMNYCQRRLR